MADAGPPLAGGWRTVVRREGDHVIRTRSPWSESVVELLDHLRNNGVDWSPRPVGAGFDEHGREVLTFVPGESPQPHPWTDIGVARVGVMVRELHDATADFVPREPAVWMDWFGRDLGDSTRGFGHGDLGPWNIMAIDGVPCGFIDWDTAGPIDPVWEVAQAAWLNAQLHDDDLADQLGLGTAKTRAGQLAAFVDGYGLERNDRRGLIDKMVEFAVHSAHTEAAEHNVTAETTTGIAGDGYPFAWAIAWRVNSASWMLRNRATLERAIAS